MTTWNKSTETWNLKNRIKSVDDPIKAFKIYQDIKRSGVAWNSTYEMFGKSKKAENVKKDIDTCVEVAEKSFIGAMDHWIYSVQDEDFQDYTKEAAERAGSLEGNAKYNMLYTISGCYEKLPELWESYQNLLEERGMLQDETHLKSLKNSIVELCSEVHTVIYDETSGVAYA